MLGFLLKIDKKELTIVVFFDWIKKTKRKRKKRVEKSYDELYETMDVTCL